MNILNFIFSFFFNGLFEFSDSDKKAFDGENGLIS